MTKKAKVASFGFVSVLFAVILVGAFFGFQLLKAPVSSDRTEVLFDVAPGMSLGQIANDLSTKSLIRNSKSFQIYAKVKGQAAKFKVGEYSLNQAMTPDEIITILVSGKSVARNVTVAEGLNIFDIAEVMEKEHISTKEEFLKLVQDRVFIKSLLKEDLPSLEGYLFPETYKVTKFEGLQSVVTQMVNRFLTVWKEIEPEAKTMGWTRNEVVTFASIVEKETGASFERPLVSSVFHNRIDIKMRLQTDPTILYGLALKQGKMPKNITKNDLLTPGPYNTYTIPSLPPTPIANPGKEALQAAVKPAQTKYLYFVSQNNGTHIFSASLQDHNKAVQQFQMNSKARENSSWRDLKQPAPPTTNK